MAIAAFPPIRHHDGRPDAGINHVTPLMIATDIPIFVQLVFAGFFWFGLIAGSARDVIELLIGELALLGVEIGVITLGFAIGKLNAFLVRHQSEFFRGLRFFGFFNEFWVHKRPPFLSLGSSLSLFYRI